MFSLKIKSVPLPYHYQWLASSKSVCRKVGTYPPSQAMTTKLPFRDRGGGYLMFQDKIRDKFSLNSSFGI